MAEHIHSKGQKVCVTRAIRFLGVAHVAHGGVAHGAPQNALYGFDVVLPVKSLQLLMFQGKAGSQQVARGVAHGACVVARRCATTRTARDM
jgi:hypothetical protein